ncbi:MAG TPA: FecR domain-containing protein [Longimicrobiales bacterium]|nr:FecR domain-containing protein [Longimicrobiales bacterium]
MIDDQQAEELAIKRLQGRATQDERDALAAWEQASPAHEGHARALQTVWAATMPAADADPGSVPSAADLLARRRRASAVAGRGPARRAVRWGLRGAAAAALVVLGAGLGRMLEERDPEFGRAEYRTDAAQVATVRLGDGTIVRLAPNSRLRIIGRRGERRVWLDGRAFFGVAHLEDRPFTIRTSMGEVAVLGTRFDLGVEGKDLQLVVVEGRVALSASGRRVEVGSGEVSRVHGASMPTVAKVADVDALLRWMDSSLVFQNTPLSRVVAELERRYHVDIDLRDSAIAQRTVTAAFTNETFEEIVRLVCQAADLRCSINRGGAVLAPNPHPETM